MPEPKKILVVDDEQQLALAVKIRLQSHGYQVVTANNGQAALEIAAAEKPDLVLLDVLMPVMDGYSCLREMNTRFGRGKLPIRVLKNEFTREFEAAERSGASAEVLASLNASRTLKMAAFDGDIEQGKVEIGQSVGLIDELVPAAVVVERLIAEFEAVVERLALFRN